MAQYLGFSSVNDSSVDGRLSGVNLVKQDLLNHFLTQPGSVPGRPAFGSRLTLRVGELHTREIRQKIKQDVIDVINYDPRVRLLSLDIDYQTTSIMIRADLEFIELNITDFITLNLTQTGLAG
jgi:phage baseplate assembly protein W